MPFIFPRHFLASLQCFSCRTQNMYFIQYLSRNLSHLVPHTLVNAWSLIHHQSNKQEYVDTGTLPILFKDFHLLVFPKSPKDLWTIALPLGLQALDVHSSSSQTQWFQLPQTGVNYGKQVEYLPKPPKSRTEWKKLLPSMLGQFDCQILSMFLPHARLRCEWSSSAAVNQFCYHQLAGIWIPLYQLPLVAWTSVSKDLFSKVSKGEGMGDHSPTLKRWVSPHCGHFDLHPPNHHAPP